MKKTKTILTIKVQGSQHWHAPGVWNWPAFHTENPWKIIDVDEKNGVLTVAILDDEDDSEENGK